MRFWDWRLLTCSNLILLIANASLWGAFCQRVPATGCCPTDLCYGAAGWHEAWRMEHKMGSCLCPRFVRRAGRNAHSFLTITCPWI
ncbi:hypothetical protein V8C43DRAFT_22064 [Trichoderma afarasin]